MTAFFPSDVRKVRPSRRHGAYRAMLRRTGRQDTLAARKGAGLPVPLSEEEVRDLVALLCHRCQPRTRDAVGRYFANLASAPTRWWHERITHERDRWCYTAGQDYPAEIRGIRAEILRSA